MPASAYLSQARSKSKPDWLSIFPTQKNSSPRCRRLQCGAGGLESPYGATLVRELRPEWAPRWTVHCAVHSVPGAIEFPAEANPPDRVQSGSGGGWICGENSQRMGNETAKDNG